MIFDLRSDEEKENWQRFREPFTFRKTNFNVWKERPQLVNRECVIVKNWRPTVHFIEKQNVVVFIALKDEVSISLIFYDADNFYELQRVDVQRHDFECAMIVNEMSSEVKLSKDNFVIGLFRVQMDPSICKFVEIVRNDKKITNI